MMRVIARAFGLLFLLAGFAVGLIDGTRSIAADGLDWTSTAGIINWFFPQGTSLLQEGVVRHIHPLLWDPLLSALMPLPVILLFFATGALILALARSQEAIPDQRL
jgi:hypothetical protein